MHKNAVADGKGGGLKADIGKVRMDLLPFDSIEEVAKVLTYGASKYADRNWEKGMGQMRLIGAALRHTWAYVRGEDRDPETGLLHTAHAVTCLLFVTSYNLRRMRGTDDRPVEVTIAPTEDDVKDLMADWAERTRKSSPLVQADYADVEARAVALEIDRLGASKSVGQVCRDLTGADAGDPLTAREMAYPELRMIPRGQVLRTLAVPGEKLMQNADGKIDQEACEGDSVLVCDDDGWKWCKVRAKSVTMDGLKYNVALVEGQTSITMVPHRFVFAIETTYAYYGGTSNSSWQVWKDTLNGK